MEPDETTVEEPINLTDPKEDFPDTEGFEPTPIPVDGVETE